MKTVGEMRPLGCNWSGRARGVAGACLYFPSWHGWGGTRGEETHGFGHTLAETAVTL